MCRADRAFSGMHFVNPPVRMQRSRSSPAHTRATTRWKPSRRLPKTRQNTGPRPQGLAGIHRQPHPRPADDEAAWLVHDDAATIAEVDSTTKYDIGLPMGTFELADQVGIDVGYHVLQYMHEVLGDAYEPCPLLEEKVENEELGKKTGKGFYDDENGGVDIPPDAGREDVEHRLVAVMANEVGKPSRTTSLPLQTLTRPSSSAAASRTVPQQSPTRPVWRRYRHTRGNPRGDRRGPLCRR